MTYITFQLRPMVIIAPKQHRLKRQPDDRFFATNVCSMPELITKLGGMCKAAQRGIAGQDRLFLLSRFSFAPTYAHLRH
ncbi:MAG: hypothetical protein CSA29_02015 [Desulfobacterales bacterium]|nr:MAG: hypothetical protein CSA29_02015 [Desulfobacterales bacterium]